MEDLPAMRAVVASEGGGVRIASLPRPRPAAGEILLRLRCCGLCGTDVFKLEHGLAAAGTALGHEVVGAVEAVGAAVSGFAPGDRLAVPHHVACGRCALCLRGSDTLCAGFREEQLAPGGFSEFVLVRERAAARAARRLPAGLGDEAAVFLEPGACVVRAVRRAEIPADPRLETTAVVLGAGSMGLLHLLVLRALHPRMRILVVDPLGERRTRAESLGADAAAAPEPDELRTWLAASGGADAVFDTAGGSERLELALELTREGGSVVLFAHAPPGGRASFDLNRLFKHERRVVGTYSSGLSDQETAFDLLATGRLDPAPLVSHRLPLSRFAEGLDLARRRAALKVLFVPDRA